ncbi:SMP-30/gluconolactonase/LRE family protein [Pseudomonas sp. Q1-7]|uniref:SMP-30/gluconolactonase/LRE family protein n=1 Tax=Pseudomonas sp. Q1-7 TaxID=3020843 RepID=UPI0023012005|nr:SMP-30/gluconolactonase/LRE family protein [Pseudomonas sp. Q1-7]
MTVVAPMEVELDAGNILGEGILWCDRTQTLSWTDIQRATLFRLRPGGGVLQQWHLPERLASLALCEDEGWLLLALASRLAFFRLSDGALRTLHEIEPGLPTRCNDGACDRQGRFVFGTLHEPSAGPRQPLGGFWRLHTDLSLERLPLLPVAIANSLAFSPDGTILYYCDSPSRQIHCCPYGETLGPPRLFADLGAVPGVPDGSCVDADGHLWNAQWGLGRVVRYAPDGAAQGIWPVPALQPTRPAFGGPLLDMLYLTSAREGRSITELAKDPLAGSLFRCQPGVRGLPEPRFAGTPE